MTNKESPVLLLGSYGRGNIGDDIFLLAALELLGNRRIYVNSADDSLLPEAARRRVHTLSTEKVDFRKKLNMLRDIKAVIYWGGDTWVKWYGDRMPRQLLYKMIIINFVARCLGKKVLYVGCGIGKLSGYSLFLARLSARLAHRIIARESRSESLLATGNVDVQPDLAINIPYYKRSLHKKARKKFVVGISTLYYLPNPETTFPMLTRKLAEFIQSLPEDKFEVVLYPMLRTPQVPMDDVWAADRLQEVLAKRKLRILKPNSVEEAIGELGNMDILVGARLHANILGTLQKTPCLGIAYRPKVASFFADNDLSEFCIALDNLDDLQRVFWKMYDDYDNVVKRFYEASETNLKAKEIYQHLVREYID